MRTVLANAAVSAVDADGTEYRIGHVVVEDGRIVAVGAGPADGDVYVDASGCLITPGLVNTHHHLYQWATRGLAADSTLFQWLVELYPIWSRLDCVASTPEGSVVPAM